MGSSISRTDLESHANMVVLENNTLVITDTVKTVGISPFTHNYKSMKNMPIIDRAIVFDYA